MAKYGIKHTSGVVSAITIFNDNIVAAGFLEITKAKYDEFIADFKSNPFITYDVSKNELSKDAIALADAQDELQRREIRLQLLELSNELDLQVRMSESTTATQAEFDALKTTYEGL